MTQHTSRLCKGYFTKKESDEVLHQMTWPPQSPDLNPIEMVWDDLDRGVKEKLPTIAQHMRELLKDVGKAFQVKRIEGMPRVINAKSSSMQRVATLMRIYLDLFNTFLVTT